jgi:hypothetical protein
MVREIIVNPMGAQPTGRAAIGRGNARRIAVSACGIALQ